MKLVVLYTFLFLFLVSCGNEKNKVGKNPEGQLVLVFEEQSSSSFFSDMVFGKMKVIPLETNEKSLVGNEYELLLDSNHFFIFDKQQETILRFSKSGKFLNSIGRLGQGPSEYTYLSDYYIDDYAEIVEILNPHGQILRYNYDGTFISKHNDEIFPASVVSFVKTGTNYWFNIGIVQEANEGQLIKKANDGIVTEKFLPVKTNWPLPFGIVRNFTQCGDITTFREYISHTVYHITDDGPIEAVFFDFGKYGIPKGVFEGDFPQVLDDWVEKGSAIIYNFLENERYIYTFFQILKNEEIIGNYHWILNKNSGNNVLQKFSSDDPIYQMLEGAKVITADNELVFMADAQILKTCTDPFFSNANRIGNSLVKDANPVIIHLKINNF